MLYITFRAALFVGLAMLGCWVRGLPAAEDPSLREAEQALQKAVRFFREQVSAEGGYIYRLSADLEKREGEVAVGPLTAWLEPPATPSVGLAYLKAWQLTGDRFLRDAAVETAMALVRGQLQSGGWDNQIEFDPEVRRRYAYRVDGGTGKSNTTTFDDDKSQSALRFLMALDAELNQQDAAIHEAVQYAITAVLKAQYPNGAWPQRYREFPQGDDFPVRRASYPDEWSRTFPGDDYQGYYTLNDNTIADLIRTMLDAYDIYGDERCLQSARRGGDFFVLAQMPDPQPAWAQQYDREMHPAWARKFEPPAISGGESQGALQTLMLLYERTGDRRYLEPVPRALEYLRNSQLPDGRLARFYELRSNKPLYFTKDYQLTDSNADMPTHYAFIVSSKIDRLEQEYERLSVGDAGERQQATRQRPVRPALPKLSSRLRADARRVIDALDDRGAWVEAGQLKSHQDDDTSRVIETTTFVENLGVLSRYIAALRAADN